MTNKHRLLLDEDLSQSEGFFLDDRAVSNFDLSVDDWYYLRDNCLWEEDDHP